MAVVDRNVLRRLCLENLAEPVDDDDVWSLDCLVVLAGREREVGNELTVERHVDELDRRDRRWGRGRRRGRRRMCGQHRTWREAAACVVVDSRKHGGAVDQPIDLVAFRQPHRGATARIQRRVCDQPVRILSSLREGSRARDTDIAGVNLDVRDGEHRVGNAILFFRLVQQPIAGAEDSHFDIRIFSGEPYSILTRLVGNRVTTVAVGGAGAEVVLDGERIDIVGLDRQAFDARIGLGIYDQACNSSVGHATLGPYLEDEVHPLGERVFEGESDALGRTLLFVRLHGPCALESS